MSNLLNVLNVTEDFLRLHKIIFFFICDFCRCQEEFQKDYMEDLDKNEYEESLAKAETEDDKKNITLEYQVNIAFSLVQL